MAVIHKLSATKIRELDRPGRYADGAGLVLQVTHGADGSVNRSWFCRLRLPGGKTRDMGLGRFDLVPLAEARKLAVAARIEAKAGRDPLAKRQSDARAARIEDAHAMTFKECAERYIVANAPRWVAKHRALWRSSLAEHAFPALGDLPVSLIGRSDVLAVLQPIWFRLPETARRVRQRIECVIDYAVENGHRAAGDNPARRAGLRHTLPPRAAKVKNHPALPFAQMPAFWRELAQREGMGAQALAFAILCAARTGEVIGARWEEIDLGAKTWTVPPDRMKAGRAHRVPLSAPALALLRRLKPQESGLVFAAPDGGALSNMAMLAVLKRMGRSTITVHGMRATFKTWASETTGFASEIAEAALAHVVGDKVESAYRRGDMLDRRRQLMDAWATFCTAPARKTR